MGLCYILMYFTVNRNYFLFLATITAPAATTATPATAATPSTPVFELGFEESPVVGASVAGASVTKKFKVKRDVTCRYLRS